MSSDSVTVTMPSEIEIDLAPKGESGQTVRSIYGMDVNYAAANSWYCYLPLENILGSKYGDLNLHVTRFSLPQQVMLTDSVSYKGYSKEIPLKVLNPDTKELTLEYMVDEKWHNYKALYNWMSGIYGTLNPVTNDSTTQKIQPTDYIPLRIYLLDNYKNRVVQFLFENTFIKTFNDLALEQNNSDVVTHSFTFAYENFKIEDI